MKFFRLALYALFTLRNDVMGMAGGTQNGSTVESANNPSAPIVRLVWSIKISATSATSSKSVLLGKRLGTSLETTQQNTVYTLVSGEALSEYWSLATDYPRGRIYYSDFVKNHIGVFFFQTGHHQKLYHGKSFGIDGIAVDWMTGNVYWTDTSSNEIVVVDYNFRFHKSITSIMSSTPAKIAIDAITGSIFWSERSRLECRLLRSDLAGKNRVVLHHFRDVISIDELSVDVKERRLYWTERVRGSPRRSRIRYLETGKPSITYTLYEAQNTQLTGIASHQDSLYICDQIKNSFLLFNKTTNETSPVFQHKNNVRPKSVVIYANEVQPYSHVHHFSHPCTFALCNQLCLVTGTSFECACDVGYTLSENGITCTLELKEEDFMLLIDSVFRKFYQISMNDPSKFNAIPMKGGGSAYAVAYDPVDDKLYWTDAGRMLIWRAFLNGSNEEVFLNGTRVYSLSLDPISRNLYIADENIDAIVVVSLELPQIRYTMHVHNIHAVFELFVSPQLGKVFWTDWGKITEGKQRGLVEMVNSDGTDRKVIVNSTSSPHGITADHENGIVYWTESFSEAIGWYNLFTEKSGRYKLQTNGTYDNLAGLSYHSNYLYFTDYEHNNVQRIAARDVLLNQTRDSSIETFGPTIFQGVSSLAIISTNISGSTSCSTNRGNCPQICLPSKHNAATCKCKDYSNYLADQHACSQVSLSGDITKPSFGNNCPGNIVIPTDRCSEYGTFYFDMPNATDDSGRVFVKSQRLDESPYNLSAGYNYMRFTASDLSGNEALCSFLVFVREISCNSSPKVSLYEAFVEPSCGRRFGSVLNATCHNNGMLSGQFECGLDNKWSATFSDSSICFPVTSEPNSAPVIKTTGGASTTNSISVTTNFKKENVTSATLTPTSSNKINNKTTSSNIVLGVTKEQLSSKQNKTLHGGLIAFIVLLIIVVIVIASVFIYKKFGNKNLSGKLVIWKQREDQVQLTAEPEGHIYHFNDESHDNLAQPIL